MRSNDVDAYGQYAAQAARNAVVPVVDAALAAPRRRATSRARPMVLAGVGLALAVVSITFALYRAENLTTVSTGPAGGGLTPTVLPAPSAGLAPRSPSDTPIATGNTSDGRPWSLFIGGPSADLCLGVELGEGGSRVRTDTCAGAAGGAPAPDPYRPRLSVDSRTPLFVFGRVPADVVEVEIIRAPEPALGPAPSTRVSDGAFYAVELPNREKPVAVVGHRTDGTSVRYALSE